MHKKIKKLVQDLRKQRKFPLEDFEKALIHEVKRTYSIYESRMIKPFESDLQS